MSIRHSIIAIAAALLVAGCGGSDDDSKSSSDGGDSKTETTKSTSDEDDSDAADDEEAEDAAKDAEPGSSDVEFTKPGTELKFGESATVPFLSNDVQGAISVTVTGIDKGKTADLAPLDLGDRVAGQTPYYVRIKVENASGSEFAFTSLGLSNPILKDGERAQKVSVIGDFKPCDSGSAGDDFTSEGATYETCEVGLAGSGSEVAGLSYIGSTYDDYDGAPDYSDEPITWKK